MFWTFRIVQPRIPFYLPRALQFVELSGIGINAVYVLVHAL